MPLALPAPEIQQLASVQLSQGVFPATDDSVKVLGGLCSYLSTNPSMTQLISIDEIFISFFNCEYNSDFPQINSLALCLAEYLTKNCQSIVQELGAMPDEQKEQAFLFLIVVTPLCNDLAKICSHILLRNYDLVDQVFPCHEGADCLATWFRAYSIMLGMQACDAQMQKTCRVHFHELVKIILEEHHKDPANTLIAETLLEFNHGTFDAYAAHTLFCVIVKFTADYDKLMKIDDYEQLFQTWRNTSVLENKAKDINAHIRAMTYLENQMPGSTAELREIYGIRCFGRYDPETLIEQLKYTEFGVSSVFLINLYKDEMGSFADWKAEHSNLAQQVYADGSQLLIIEAANLEQIKNYIGFFSAEVSTAYVQSIMFASHGDKQGLSIDIASEQIDREIWNSQLRVDRQAGQFFVEIGNYILESGEIVFLACQSHVPANLISKLVPHAFISAFSYYDNASISGFEEGYFKYKSVFNERAGIKVYYQGEEFLG